MSKIVLISLYDYIASGTRNIQEILKQEGYESNIIFFKELLMNRIIEPSEIEIELLIKKIKELNPDVIGLSVRSPLFKIAVKLNDELKKLKKLVVFGGIHAMIKPEECIKYTDVVCIGEGEKTLIELMKKIKNQETISNIKNLWIKRNCQIEKNPLDDLNQDLDSVSFFNFSEKNKYYLENNTLISGDPIKNHSTYHIMVGRGCPFACSYCENSFLHKLYEKKGKFIRLRSVDNVIKELIAVKKGWKIKHIAFDDEVFILNKDWLKDFLKKYKEKICLPFGVDLHPSAITEESIKMLKEAGLEKVTMGIQSGSEKIRWGYV